MEMKRITRLSGCDSLAILFSSTDSETIHARIEDQGWITVNNGEVYIFEGLNEGSCYHITAKTETEELRLAFSTQYNIPKPTPYTYYHVSNTDRKRK
ncbi:MAG: hypothetical protein GX947_02505 [Tissierellia bacterium]|nr:hypothetical protein [Tissierellia bacterium]